MRKNHGACAALLNPSSAEPIVWPSALKFISELNDEARTLLECALMEANREREDVLLKRTGYSMPSPLECDHASDNLSEVISLSSFRLLFSSGLTLCSCTAALHGMEVLKFQHSTSSAVNS